MRSGHCWRKLRRPVIEQTNNDHVTAIALRAMAIAHERQHEFVTLEHILLALLERGDVRKCLRELGVNHEPLGAEVNTYFTEPQERVLASPARSREFDVVLGRTVAYAQFSSRRT